MFSHLWPEKGILPRAKWETLSPLCQKFTRKPTQIYTGQRDQASFVPPLRDSHNINNIIAFRAGRLSRISKSNFDASRQRKVA
jgi:hypothetical protein